MNKNLSKLNGLFNSQVVLLELTQKGMLREDAYTIVQQNAMKTWNKNTSFFHELKTDKRVMTLLSKAELEKIFENQTFLNNVDLIFARVFLED
jgi:adenylosuccinate lyase